MPFPAFFLLAAALGGRDFLANRAEKESLLDREAERIDAINKIGLGLDAQGVSNQFDARQIEAMQEQFISAQAMLRSKDPKLQALGASRIQALDSAIRGNIQQNETEARADLIRLQDQEVVEAGAGKADNEKRFERSLKMNEQLNAELKPFGAAQLAFGKVMNLLDNDDQLASLAGLTAFVQAIDDSVVREGELLKYQGANGFITDLVNRVNKSEGRDFDPATKRSIRNAAAALMNAQKTQATAIVNSYQDRATSFVLDVPKVLSGIDENLFTPIPIDRTAQDAREAEADAAEAAAGDIRPLREDLATVGGVIVEPSFTNLGEGGALIADKALQAWQAGGRALRGASLHINGTTGEIWEKDAQGKWTRIRGTPDQQRRAEILRLKNSGTRLTPAAQKRLDDLERELTDEEREENRRGAIIRTGTR